MYIALGIATVLLAGMCAMSAAGKFTKKEQVLEIVGGIVGVPVSYFPALGTVLLVGAVGVAAGLWVKPIGIAAAAVLVAYFVGAVAGHLRVGDTKNLAMPVPPLVLSIVVLVLRLAA